MVIRRFDIGSRHFLVLVFLLFVRIITNVNSQTGPRKAFYYLLHDAPIVESLNEEEDLFQKIIVSRFDGRFPSDIKKFFTLCARKSAVLGAREVLGLIRGVNDLDSSTNVVPTGALVTDCVVACDVAAGFFPIVGVAVISSGCASARPEETTIANVTIVRMKASWYSLVNPLLIFLNHFKWTTVAIVSSYKAGLKTAADLVGGSLRRSDVIVNFFDADTESDLILASDAAIPLSGVALS